MSTLAEKVERFRKGKSQSAVVMYSVPRTTKFAVFPATICPDGLPQLVAANSPQQVKQYSEMGFAVYKPAKVSEDLRITDNEPAPLPDSGKKQNRKSKSDE